MQYDTIIESGPVEAIVLAEPDDNGMPVILIGGEPYSMDKAVALFNVLYAFLNQEYAPSVSVHTEPVGEAE